MRNHVGVRHPEVTRCLLVLALGLASTATARAQEYELGVQREPHYVGESVLIQLDATNFTKGEKPQVRVAEPLPDGIRVAGPRISQSYGSVVDLAFGRRVQQQHASYRYAFYASATNAGTYEIGPFEVTVDGEVVKRFEARQLTFQDLEVDENMYVNASLEGEEFYVGQRVPLSLTWGYKGDMTAVQYAFDHHAIRSPLFDQFRVVINKPRTRTRLTVESKQGEASIDAVQAKETIDGDEYIVLKSGCTLEFEATGEFEVPISCRSKNATRWGRDILGRARAIDATPVVTMGEPLKVRVLPLPTVGRPESFVGAVGSEYAIAVSANRNVVRVGDPLALTIEVSGEGLEKMALPPLEADGGLDAQLFQLPRDQPSGVYSRGVKQFKVNIQVKDESVSEIPPIAFSWFDPATKGYQTARSQPIAIDVNPAQLISADDVVAGATSSSTDRNMSDPGSGTDKARWLGVNLAINEDLPSLVGSDLPIWRTKSLVRTGLYSLGMLVVGGAWLVQRLRRGEPVDPSATERRQELERTVNAVDKSASKENLEELARALRAITHDCDAESRKVINQLVEQCEQHIYAPDTSDRNTSDLTQRAADVIQRLR